MEWDESFKDRADCSGRSVAGVHDAAYDDSFLIRSTTVDETFADNTAVRSGEVNDFRK